MIISKTEKISNYSLLWILAIFSVFPLIGVFLSSLTPEDSPVKGFNFYSFDWTLSNYRNVFEKTDFANSLLLSFQMTSVTVFVSSICSILAGYAFGTMKFPYKNSIFYLFIIGLLMPFETMIIPIFYFMRDWGLLGTIWSVALPSIGLSIAFGTFWMRAFFLSFPNSLIEAARMDGASSLKVLIRVALPNSIPIITTMVLLIAMWTWNDFFLSLVMGLNTAPRVMFLFTDRYSSDIAGIAAASILVALPVLILFVVLQRHFVRGLMGGSVNE
jgi:raffinose/stachyose/melibiose transport system permease protein